MADSFGWSAARVKPAVRPLAERLRRDGLKVWFDQWEIPVAASRQSAAFSTGGQTREDEDGGALPSRRYAETIEDGLEHSPFGFQPSAFSLQPLLCAPLNQERRFIPLRLDDAPISGKGSCRKRALHPC